MSEIVDRLRLLVPSDSSGAAFDGVNEITRLTAEVDWHKENSARCQDTQAALLWEITHLTAERNKLRSALLVARKYVLVQSCELSLQPEDAARDLDVIDEALEEDDD